MRKFWGEEYKNYLSVLYGPPAAGGSAPRPPRCYSRIQLQNFVEFVSYSSMRFTLPLKQNKIPAVNILPLLLPHYCTYFSLQTVV